MHEEKREVSDKKALLDMLASYPAAATLTKLAELRASDKFTDIKRESRAPKGKYCDNCINLTTKYEPRICSFNGEQTGSVQFSYCLFFNQPLCDIRENSCYSHSLKCIPCSLQTEVQNG